MNRKLKIDFRFLVTKATRDCAMHCLCFCVSVSSRCVLVHVLTYVYDCFIGKELSCNENGKF